MDSEGITVKYNVIKVEDGTPVFDCFVLRPDKDNAAVVALRAYARASDNPQLAADIFKWVGNPPPLTLKDLTKRDEQPVYVMPTEKSNGKWEAYWGFVSVHNKAIFDVWETVLRFEDVGDICNVYDFPPISAAV